MKTILLIAFCSVATLPIPVLGQEGDPLRGKITELEQRARAAGDQGRVEESRELTGQLHRLREEMNVREARHRIEEPHKAGKQGEAAQIEHRIEEARGDAERRQHALEAIQHLHLAGLHEPAGRIEQMLRAQDQEQMEQAMREMQEQTQRALRETHEQIAKMTRTIEELREQVGKLRGDGGPRKQ